MKQYIGDSVYLDYDPEGNVILTTENGYGPTNIIVLDIDVLETFLYIITNRKPEKNDV